MKLWKAICIGAGLALFGLALFLGFEARASEAPPARDDVISRIHLAQLALREQAGPQWRIKASRAERELSGKASAADEAALDAEASARGEGETRVDLAAHFANRGSLYLSALARLDGTKRRALKAIDTGADAASVLSSVDADIAAALETLPKE